MTGPPAGAPERRREADRLIDAALDLPAERRDAFVAESCRGDAELERLVRRLLARIESLEGDLGTAPIDGPLGRSLLDRVTGAEHAVVDTLLLEPVLLLLRRMAQEDASARRDTGR